MRVDYDGSDARIEERRAGVVAKSCKCGIWHVILSGCGMQHYWVQKCDSRDNVDRQVWLSRCNFFCGVAEKMNKKQSVALYVFFIYVWLLTLCSKQSVALEMSFLSMCDYWHCVRNRCGSTDEFNEKKAWVWRLGWCLEQCGILKVRTPK
jgi:hypothetical protein